VVAVLEVETVEVEVVVGALWLQPVARNKKQDTRNKAEKNKTKLKFFFIVFSLKNIYPIIVLSQYC